MTKDGSKKGFCKNVTFSTILLSSELSESQYSSKEQEDKKLFEALGSDRRGGECDKECLAKRFHRTPTRKGEARLWAPVDAGLLSLTRF